MHLLPDRTRLFHLSTENGRSESVRDGQQSLYSRAGILFTVYERYIPRWKRIKSFLIWKSEIK